MGPVPVSRTRVWIEFLGSMSLAITLLAAVAVGSVIGSVLQQDQTWPDYFAEFGPFWFEVFRTLGLYEVYSAPWFVGLLLFLVTSTGVCVLRRAPGVVREATGYRLSRPAAALRNDPVHREGISTEDPTRAETRVGAVLRARGYRTRVGSDGQARLIAGRRGQWGRFGDLLIHLGIVTLALGALIDANLPLHGRAALGDLKPRADDTGVDAFGDDARLDPTFGAFRGQVTVPEGQRSDVAYVPLRDGYVLQELPFDIELQDFRVEYYPDGQPRQYESDLRLHGPGEETRDATLAVNAPVRHAGHTLYQSSFEDGGSELSLRLWSLQADQPARSFEGRVGGAREVRIAENRHRLEFESLEQRNPRPDPAAGEGAFRDAGPALQYRVRDDQGRALEVRAYQEPQPVEGRGDVFLSGVRSDPDARFRYLEIPADHRGTPEGFLQLASATRNAGTRRDAAREAVERVLEGAGVEQPGLVPSLARFADRLVLLWVQEGEKAVEQRIQTYLDATAGDARTRAVLEEILGGLLFETFDAIYQRLIDDGVMPEVPAEGARRGFVERAAPALADLPAYSLPFYVEVAGFDPLRASGIQVTRAPGTPLVLSGAIGLVIGLGILFYVPRHRVWVRLTPGGTGAHCVIGARATRAGPDEATVNALTETLEVSPQGKSGAA